MKKYGRLVLAFCVMLSVWCGTKVAVSAEEQDTGWKAVTYTMEDLQGGVIVVPPGNYQTIAFGKSIKNAVVYLHDVNVSDYVSIYGDGKSTPTFVLTGTTEIGKVILKGNATITAPDDVRRLRTVSVRERIKLNLEVAAKYVSIVEGVSGVKGNYYRPVGNFLDQGEYGVHTLYGTTSKVEMYGKNNTVVAEGYLKNTEVLGQGNELSVRCEIGRVILNGKYSVLSLDTQLAQVQKLFRREKDACIVRGERIGLDQKKDAPTECKALFIGDSFTERLYREGYLTDDREGLFGWGTAPADWYVDSDKYLTYLDRLSDYKPEKIIYLYGINDIKLSQNIEYSKLLLTTLSETYPDAEIYVQRVFPTAATWEGSDKNYYTYEDLNWNGDYNVVQYNRELEAFCAGQKRLNWVDTTGDMIDGNGNLKKEMTDDGLHLSGAAYAEWWKELQKIINK